MLQAERKVSMLIRMIHVRQARMCSSGARQFFARHGLDWTRFLKEGIESEELEKTGDAMAREVVRVARG
jgi:hypothetical protein